MDQIIRDLTQPTLPKKACLWAEKLVNKLAPAGAIAPQSLRDFLDVEPGLERPHILRALFEIAPGPYCIDVTINDTVHKNAFTPRDAAMFMLAVPESANVQYVARNRTLHIRITRVADMFATWGHFAMWLLCARIGVQVQDLLIVAFDTRPILMDSNNCDNQSLVTSVFKAINYCGGYLVGAWPTPHPLCGEIYRLGFYTLYDWPVVTEECVHIAAESARWHYTGDAALVNVMHFMDTAHIYSTVYARAEYDDAFAGFLEGRLRQGWPKNNYVPGRRRPANGVLDRMINEAWELDH